MSARFVASAPGNLMILGEHAVLRGYRALVCAVNRRMQVTLTPRNDRQIVIQSALGTHRTELDHLELHHAFRFVMAAVELYRAKLSRGFDLSIESEFSHQIGFGSSAAVTVAMVAVLASFTDQPTHENTLFIQARDIIRTIQGLGSGADVAASVFGGLVAYRADPLELIPLSKAHPITIIYSGSKMPTVEVVRLVNSRYDRHPELFTSIFRLMDQSVATALSALEQDDWETLGHLLNINQGLMEAIGVSNAALAEIVHALRSDPCTLGSKISGSGLGDCVIGLGKAECIHLPYELIPAQIDPHGLSILDKG